MAHHLSCLKIKNRQVAYPISPLRISGSIDSLRSLCEINLPDNNITHHPPLTAKKKLKNTKCLTMRHSRDILGTLFATTTMTVIHLTGNKKMRHFHKNKLGHLFIVSLYHNIAHMKKLATLLFSIFIIAAKAAAQQAILQEDLALKYLVQLPTQKSANPPVVILLHGYGSDERDLFELRNFFPKNYMIIAARAPYKLPNGYQWYEMTEVNGIHDGNPAQLTNSRNQIKKFINQVISKYHADPKAVYLSGFSQGAIMSYQVGLTAPQMLRGIAVLSGTIYPSLKPLVKKSASLSELKIFISHGNVDDRIPFTDGLAASDYLEKLGLNPDFHKYVGMGHSISKDVLFDFVNWLKK